MATDDLRAFIEARLAEDETIARFATPALGEEWREWSVTKATTTGVQYVSVDDHVRRHSPARVLREVAAKRAILAIADDQPEADWDGRQHTHWLTMDKVLRALATVWQDHPDYRPEWSTT
jgi:hypothetical protein